MNEWTKEIIMNLINIRKEYSIWITRRI
jgi:hypothetical protein